MAISFVKKLLCGVGITLLILYLFKLLLFLVILPSYPDTPIPSEKAARWVCNDPYFVLEYREELKERPPKYGYRESLEIDGVLQTVDAIFESGNFVVYPEGSPHWEDRLMTGTYEYEGDRLVLHMKEDFVFNGHYKEMRFAAETLDS